MGNEADAVRYSVVVVCCKCKNTTFTLSKITKAYKTRHEMVYAGVLAHDGWGWDLNEMDVVCAKCGGEPEVDIEPLQNGEGEESPDGE